MKYLNQAFVALLCVQFSSPVFAGLSLSQKMNQLSEKKSPVTTNCPVLTGQWQGECRDQDSKVTQEHLTIEQDSCEVIVVDHVPLTVGGDTAIGVRSQNGTSDISAYSDWDASKQKLEVRTQWRLRAFNELTFITDTSRTHYYLDGEQLKRDESGRRTTEAAGGNAINNYSSQCVYTYMKK